MYPLFNIVVEHERDRLVVRAVGELDRSTADQLATVIRHDYAGQTDLVIDLGELAFMDCAGLRVLLYAHARAQSNGRGMNIVDAPGLVRRIVRVAGVDDRLRFVESPPHTGSDTR